MAEEHLHDLYPAFPVVPNSLIVEGMAQTGGILVGEYNQFRERVVLAKVSRAVFHHPVTPGDTLRYTAEVEEIKPDGAICTGVSHVGDRLQAEIDLVFAHLDEARFAGVDLFRPADCLHLLRLTGLYEVGRDSQGRPLEIPPHLLEAEQAASP